MNERLKIVEETGKQLAETNLTLQKQSDNIANLYKSVEGMVKVQEAEGKRLEELEKCRISDKKMMEEIKQIDGRVKEIESQDAKKWRATVKHAISFAIGIATTVLAAFILAQLGL